MTTSTTSCSVAAGGGLCPNFAAAARRLLDLVFPRDCVITGAPVENPPWRYFSPAGLGLLDRVTAPFCATCGHPFAGLASPEQRCPRCLELKPLFQRGRVAVVARDAGRRCAHILKYHQGVWLAGDMARVMAETPGFAEFLDGAVLVPVPLHPSRQRVRGYNQARVLADALAALLPERGIRVGSLLERVRDTPTQTRLDRAARARNMLDAFEARADARIEPEARYVVIDDVFTTGATLNACCAALARRGALRLEIAAFAHA